MVSTMQGDSHGGSQPRDAIALFTGSHDEIRRGLDAMRELASTSEVAPASSSVRELLARAVLHCFERVVLPHHREEERELWPMIHRAKPDPDELARFVEVVSRLQDEHAELERRWARFELPLRALADGRSAKLDVDELRALADLYTQHVQLEDEVIVPMADLLMKPDQKTRLAISVLLSRLPVGKGGMV